MTTIDELTLLRRRRSHGINEVKSYCDSVGESGEFVSEELSVQFENLEEDYKAFQELSNSLMLLLKKDDDPEFYKVREIYIATKTAIKVFQTSDKNRLARNGVKDDSKIYDIKLPQIQLPKFNGQMKDWPNFIQVFVALVDKRSDLPEVLKLEYLKSSLYPEPLSVISGLEIVAENYQIALQTLKSRYENERVVAYNYVRELVELNSERVDVQGLQEWYDKTKQIHHSLSSTGYRGEKLGEFLFLYIIMLKLDRKLLQEWEQNTDGSINDLWKFIEKRIQSLQSTESVISLVQKQTVKTKFLFKKISELDKVRGNRVLLNIDDKRNNCVACNQKHELFKCDQFAKLKSQERFDLVKMHNLCRNCLRKGHATYSCTVKSRCKSCQKPHHTALHVDGFSFGDTKGSSLQADTPMSVLHPQPSKEANATNVNASIVANALVEGIHENSYVLLSTAIVYLKSSNGELVKARALLDNASQLCIITNELCLKLKLQNIPGTSNVICVGGTNVKTYKRVQGELYSRSRDYITKIQCSVINEITTTMPNVQINRNHTEWSYIDNYELADETWNEPGKIDILLSADVVAELLSDEVIRGPKGYPILQSTILGFVLMGACPTQRKSRQTCHLILEEQMARFWELEEIPEHIQWSEEETNCERKFVETHHRDECGRYVVRLPFKREPTYKVLGKSKRNAICRFTTSESKGFSEQYIAFMSEYHTLGHMSRATVSTGEDSHYFIPHHAVYKEQKIRVVFDASAHTTTSTSLNKLLMVGPTIQSDLFAILTRFRSWKFVLKTDIVKMYRQVLVHPDDRRFQMIVWRENPEKELCEYTLDTVTYGTSCAPFLAIRALYQLAADEEVNYPVASHVIRRDSYVDDIVTGADSEIELIKISNELKGLLNCGGFCLSKWASNSTAMLSKLSKLEIEPSTICWDSSTRTLGLQWDPKTDVFMFTVPEEMKHPPKQLTKRNVLSIVSKIFDPLGLLSPITVRGKILMQELWKLTYDWDQILPKEISIKIVEYFQSLSQLHKLRISRFCGISQNQDLELHGFADASERAYAACIYARVVCKNVITVHLLCAKSKVAPIKIVSLPKLELCAAVLLAKLIVKTRETVYADDENIFLYSDSTIVLSWLAKPPHVWKCFVANRVAKINESCPMQRWRHVISKDNAADVVSRGTPTYELLKDQWWSGPEFLKSITPRNATWELNRTAENEMQNVKHVCVVTGEVSELFNCYSSFVRLLRIVAWMLRFFRGARDPSRDGLGAPALTAEDLSRSLTTLVKVSQNETFSDEITRLRANTNVLKTSKILALTPFLDTNNVLRVQGRLRNAEITEAVKHPMILSSKSQLAALLIRYFHEKYLHAGTNLTFNLLRQQFWITPNARNTVRYLIRKCVRCARFRISLQQTQLMGDLPAVRVRQSFPFDHVGIDYAGPIRIAQHALRHKRIMKAYIAVFVCMATKAVHLELVGNLTTESFIATLRRFISRRGVPASIHSDNGTNFAGADNELKPLYAMLRASTDPINHFMSGNSIKWEFNTAWTPHQGGLWESAVKSLKGHLRKTIGEQLLTYEEMSTVLTQIEACLNSRPIAPMSTDPTDLEVLTPGHFLIGRPLGVLPDTALETSTVRPVNRLKRFQLIQTIVASTWKRWKLEYLNNLQQRPKWRQKLNNLQIDDIVIIKDIAPPTRWMLGRVMEAKPDANNVVRLVKLKTKFGIVVKHVKYLIPLLEQND